MSTWRGPLDWLHQPPHKQRMPHIPLGNTPQQTSSARSATYKVKGSSLGATKNDRIHDQAVQTARNVSVEKFRATRSNAAEAGAAPLDHGMGTGKPGNPKPLLRLLHKTFAGAFGPNR